MQRTRSPSSPGRSHYTEESAGVDVDIRGLLLMLWRRKMVVIGVLLIGLSLAIMAISVLKPQYTARALLLIESATPRGLPKDFQAIMGSVRFDTSFVLSEIEILRSRSLARSVVEKLNLMTDPEFNPQFRGEPASPSLEANPVHEENNFKTLSVYGSELESLPADVVEEQIAQVVSRFLANLEVRSVPGSFAIQVEFTSLNPKKSALIANTIVNTYIEQQLEKKFRATKKLTDWLDRRLENLKSQVRATEAAVQDFSKKHNLLSNNKNVNAAELSALNAQLINARTNEAEAKVRLEQIESLKSEKNLDNAGTYFDSPLMRSLKLDETRLERQLSELSSRYGEKHPQIIKVRSELAQLRATLQNEIGKLVQNARDELRFAEARVETLQDNIKTVSEERLESSDALIKLREIEREAESTRLIYNKFLETYKRTDNQEELQEAEARVISYAVIPESPSQPNKPLLLSLSALLSLFVGLVIVMFMEKLDNTFKSAGQLEKMGRFPCYAMIPSVEGLKNPQLANYTLSKPSSSLAESVRTLRMVINLRAREGRQPKVVTTTSSFPGEGKTTLSIWLANLAAKSGEKVILIDCDMRRPNVHRSLSKSNDRTLVEYLTGQSELDEVIQRDSNSGLHTIFARSVPNSALDLISSAKMKKLIESLKQVYDLVIIDSPACLAVSDARVLATYSDQVLYAVAWDKTPHEVVLSGAKQFADMGYDDMAFVLTNVDVKRHVRLGYGDTVYYYGNDQKSAA